jgi:hypothetical protein
MIAAFTMRPECRKCGTDRFDWQWLLPSRLAHDQMARATLVPPAPPEEHLRLTCRNCGWVLDMATKDGGEASDA